MGRWITKIPYYCHNCHRNHPWRYKGTKCRVCNGCTWNYKHCDICWKKYGMKCKIKLAYNYYYQHCNHCNKCHDIKLIIFCKYCKQCKSSGKHEQHNCKRKVAATLIQKNFRLFLNNNFIDIIEIISLKKLTLTMVTISKDMDSLIQNLNTFSAMEINKTNIKDLIPISIPIDKLCNICYLYEKNMVFIPCGHVNTCYNCSIKIDKCIICRIKPTIIHKIYY
jgi:C3HC4-type zinc finger (RING finger) protein